MQSFSTVNKSLFLFSIVLYLTALLLYGFWVHFHTEKEIFKQVDTKLYNHAVSLKYFLPNDFHDRAVDAQSISTKEDKYIANKLTKIVQETDFKYNYTIIKKEDKLFFVASDLIADPENKRGTFYYYEYEDADESFFDAFEKETPTYKTVTDKWGTVRTIMVPEKSPGGTQYLSCVDYDITFVDTLLRENLFQSIGTIIFFLLLTIPIIIAYIASYKGFLKTLKDSEEKYRRLSENAMDMIYRMSLPEGTYEYVNPASLNLTGYPPYDWYANKVTIRDIIHPDFQNYFAEQWKRLTHGDMPPTYEYMIRHKNGEDRWLYQRNVAIYNKRSEIVAIEGIVTDITERKRSESSLQESNERLFTVLNSMSATVYVTDYWSHEILFMNQHMIDLFGDDYTGSKCWKVFRGQDAPCPECKDSILVNENNEPTGVQSWHDKNPITGRWYINHDRAIRWIDGRLAKLQIASDITDFKLMEEQLRQSHKMESIGTLAGGIAHEFNNMLGIIIGNTELAIDDIPEWNPAAQSIQEIRTAGLRAKDVVRKLLSVARKAPVVRKPLQIGPVIKDSLDLLRKTIPATVEMESNLKCTEEMILGDPTELSQILINLCTNSVHAMNEQIGALEVTLEATHLNRQSAMRYDGLKPGDYARLAVKDTGDGIDPENMDRLFDPYFTTKDVDEGLGMGLAVVHGIVKNHEGAITIESEVGKGTTVEILFPLIEKQEVTETEKPEPLPNGTEHILCVDDEASLVRMVIEMLERCGYSTTGRTSSVEALKLLEENPERFDLVLTDMAMPQMAGDRLAYEIIQVRRNIPVILCTGYSDSIDEKRAKELGIKAYIMKPLSMKELAITVRKVLDENNR